VDNLVTLHATATITYPREVLLEGIVGSIAYGLDHEDSDTDLLGVYLAPTVDFLGLSVPVGKNDTYVQHKPDITHHELGKMVRLLLESNPTVTELLYLDSYTQTSEIGNQLIDMRAEFLSAPYVVNAYYGYAMAQFKRLNERGNFSSTLKNRTEKHARHLLRLLQSGYSLYAHGEMKVRVDDPDEIRTFGAMVAEDPRIAKKTLDHYNRLFDVTESVLPQEPNRELAGHWLEDVRAKHLIQEVDFSRWIAYH